MTGVVTMRGKRKGEWEQNEKPDHDHAILHERLVPRTNGVEYRGPSLVPFA